ncbi:hypothetical protein Sa4125_25360 [Aureimonas sp. SA4125]|nr:hypothetical protein Sa4125_25360 [Aureimonas sp. SA4125]
MAQVAPQALRITPSGARNALLMEYADAYGEISEREIHAPKISRYGDTVYIDAWCTLRGAERQFRADRILRLWDAGGTPIADVNAYFEGRGDMWGRLFPIPDEHRRAMARVRPGTLALVWIARTDSDVDAAEMAVILDFMDARLRIGGREAPEFDRHLARITIDEAAPIKAHAVKAVTEMKKGSAQALLLADYSARLVASAGESDPKKAGRRRQLMALLE